MTDGKLVFGSLPAKRVTAVELARDAIRNAILRGDLPGGSRLIQTEIATELGVSTTPVREAMRELASDGLITLDSHRVGIVRKPDWHEMLEIVDMRHALEELAMERGMANLSDQDLGKAKQIAATLADETLDLGTWVQINIDFHSVFHMATNAVRLAPTLVALERAAGAFVAQAQLLHPEIRARGIEGHFALIEAFETKDVDRAIEIEHEHTTLPLRAAEMSGIDPRAED